MPLTLETPRLTLRPMTGDDFEPFAAMMADADVARYLTLDQKPASRMAAWRSLGLYLGHWILRGYGFFSILEKATGAWVGRVGPWRPEGWPGLECGWGIGRRHWGKGYAPEAAVAAIKWVFAENPQLDRMISLIEPKNANSQAVARKIGEEKSGETFQIETFTLDIWSVSRAAFFARHGER